MSTNKIPLLDLSEKPVCKDIPDEVGRLINKGRFIGGDVIKQFEDSWTKKVSSGETIAVSSGTAALQLLYLRVWKVRPKRNEVIIPRTSFVATRDSAIHAGFNVRYCGVDENGLMDPSDLIRELSKGHEKVAAVVPVHLYGQVADIQTIETIADGFDVPFILEDACQAHGAYYPDTGEPVGSRHMTAWSFMPAKILSTWGDGGAITLPETPRRSHDQEWFRAARNHGRTEHNTHAFPGFKMRMDSLKAAVLSKEICLLEYYVERRDFFAKWYRHKLRHTSLRVQPQSEGRVWSYFTCWTEEAEDRDSLREFLRERGVSTGVHYRYALDTKPETQGRMLAECALTLPLWPEMKGDMIEHIVTSIEKYYDS